MEQLICRPALHMFEHCTEFADQFCLGEKDLVFTNDYIYEPCFGGLKLPVHTIYQERYGAGEPTDAMVDAILKDIRNLDFERIIAIGGGTVIDIAKVLAVAGEDNVDALYDKAPNLVKHKHLVVIPTTCGTRQRGD